MLRKVIADHKLFDHLRELSDHLNLSRVWIVIRRKMKNLPRIIVSKYFLSFIIYIFLNCNFLLKNFEFLKIYVYTSYVSYMDTTIFSTWKDQ